jgi:hypothetical protein
MPGQAQLAASNERNAASRMVASKALGDAASQPSTVRRGARISMSRSWRNDVIEATGSSVRSTRLRLLKSIEVASVSVSWDRLHGRERGAERPSPWRRIGVEALNR